jgi:hypothetical protein
MRTNRYDPHASLLRRRCAGILFLAVICFALVPAVAHAATSVTIAWDANSDGVTAGYYVYYGTQSGNYSGYVDVKSATSAVMNASDTSATYYFAVQAYSSAGDKSQMSAEISWQPTTAQAPAAQPPTLLNPGSMSTIVGQGVTVQLRATDPAGLTLTYSATGLPSGIGIAPSTGIMSGAPTTAGVFNVTATATNSANLSSSQVFAWTILAPATSGGGTGTGDTSGGGNKGGKGNNGGGNGNGNGNGHGGGGDSSTPPATSDPVDPGSYSPSDPFTDLIPPTLAIVSPTTDPFYDTDNPMVILTGTAFDNVGVANIMWTNSRGGAGTTLGTTSWATTPISLKMGKNLITITATDFSGNIQSVTLLITRYNDLQNHLN